jgi:hypothetical protein
VLIPAFAAEAFTTRPSSRWPVRPRLLPWLKGYGVTLFIIALLIALFVAVLVHASAPR